MASPPNSFTSSGPTHTPNQAPAQDPLAVAIEFHRAGNLPEAEKIYRQILHTNPKHPDALHLLGVLAGNAGHVDAAIELIGQAVAEAPGIALYCNSISDFLQCAGRFEDSVLAARKAIELQPKYPEAYDHLGAALIGLNRNEEAAAACRQAIQMTPQFADAHNHLCIALKNLGRFEEAIPSGRAATTIQPNQPLYWFTLGDVLVRAKQFEPALEALRRVHQLKPDHAEAYEADAFAMVSLGRDADALGAYEQLVRLNPGHAEAWNNIGLLRWRLMRGIESCMQAFSKAIRVSPDYPEPRYNLSLMHLLLGDFEKGWAGYEYRWQTGSIGLAPRNLPKPRWDGKALAGKTILIHAEQGSGDTMQFIRYLPMVQAMGGSIVLACQANLLRMMASHFPGIKCVSVIDQAVQYDVHCPLLSLPFMFGTRLDSIPGNVPYLHADPALVESWGTQVQFPKDCLKVGLVWSGARTLWQDAFRSLKPIQLAPLSRARNVRFYSLQTADGLVEGAAPNGMEWIDLGTRFTDFTDTAAVISRLDLVITADTAVAHLAAAMGKPTWILIRSIYPEWRWLMTGETTPWYPTARLFRQTKPGDWAGAIENVATALEELSIRHS